MQDFIDIDQQKSLARKRLHLASFWDRFVDPAVCYFVASALLCSAVLSYRAIDWNNPNDRLIGKVFLPLVLVFGVFFVYKKSRETTLLVIDVTVSPQQARNLTLRYLETEGFRIMRSNRRCVIGVSDEGAFASPRQLTVLFEEGSCLVNVLKLNPKLRVPSFLANRVYVKALRDHLQSTAYG